jgi:hypothetical protein
MTCLVREETRDAIFNGRRRCENAKKIELKSKSNTRVHGIIYAESLFNR